MPVLALLEIVEDTFVFEQTRNEVEVGFAVLHAEIDGQVVALVAAAGDAEQQRHLPHTRTRLGRNCDRHAVLFDPERAFEEYVQRVDRITVDDEDLVRRD